MQALKNHKIQSTRRAVTIVNVPESTLRGRIKGIPFYAELCNHNLRLTKVKEGALVEWFSLQTDYFI